MRNCHNKCVVPIGALASVIEDWIRGQKFYRRDVRWGASEEWMDDPKQGIGILAELSGVSERKIRGIVSGSTPNHSKNVTFDLADRLLCAMDRAGAWHHELAEFYGPIEVATYEVERELVST